jgi:TetR/AcrR family transcriptional repressor of lmrAB and yxaGH operons
MKGADMSPTRDQILQTTASLLEKQGCHATGLNEIIRESSTPKGSLYYYFPEGKEQLVSEAVLQAGHTMADRIRAHLAGETPPAQAIYDFVLRIADNVEVSSFAAGSPLTAVAMETATTSPRINAACRAAFDLLIAAFEDKLLASGLEAQRASNLAQFIIAAIEGGVILSRTMHSAEPLRVVARQLSAALAC